MISNKLVIFDICDTLFKCNTTFEFVKFIKKEGFIDQLLIRMLNNTFIRTLNVIFFRIFKKDCLRWFIIISLRGYTYSDLKLYAKAFYQEVLEKEKRDFVHILLREFHSQNCELLLMSATVDVVAEEISKQLGVLKCISSTLNYKNGLCTGTLKFDLLGKKEKYLNLEFDTIVTDNKSDLNLIKIAKNSIIISKNKNVNFWKNQNIKNINIIKV